MTDEPINPHKEETDALARLGMTHDGRLLHRFLRRMVESVCPLAMVGALPLHEGRRMFAATLMAHMAEGIESSGGRDASNSGQPDRRDDAILARPGKPTAVHAVRDRRRVQLEPGDGWNPGDAAE